MRSHDMVHSFSDFSIIGPREPPTQRHAHNRFSFFSGGRFNGAKIPRGQVGAETHFSVLAVVAVQLLILNSVVAAWLFTAAGFP